MPQGCHARIIEPYGGQIGPKLGCSCPPGDDAQALQVIAVRHLVPRSHGEMVPGCRLERSRNAEVMLPGHVLTQNNGVRVEELAGATGLEPAASCVTGRRSNQLNYPLES